MLCSWAQQRFDIEDWLYWGQIFSQSLEGVLVCVLEGDCHEAVVMPNLELVVTFGMSLEGALYT
jgi:hypothetical protein